MLSRLPVREAGRHALGPYKAAAGAHRGHRRRPAGGRRHAPHQRPHRRRRRPPPARTRHARRRAGRRRRRPELVLLGDFNDGTAAPATTLGMRDAWTEVRGDDTATFDPGVNPLAAVSSLSGRAARLDRVLLRGQAFRPIAAALCGNTPRPTTGCSSPTTSASPSTSSPDRPTTPRVLDDRADRPHRPGVVAAAGAVAARSNASGSGTTRRSTGGRPTSTCCSGSYRSPSSSGRHRCSPRPRRPSRRSPHGWRGSAASSTVTTPRCGWIPAHG